MLIKFNSPVMSCKSPVYYFIRQAKKNRCLWMPEEWLLSGTEGVEAGTATFERHLPVPSLTCDPAMRITYSGVHR